MFRKFHNTELSTRVPLLLAVPWLKETHGKHTQALMELVDVMPTLIELVCTVKHHLLLTSTLAVV
jgi:arylsulfatase A-like enzyme